MSDELQLPRAAGVFVSFVALLRLNGFAVAPEQTTAFLAAIDLLGPRSAGIVQSGAEMIFTSNRVHGLGAMLTPFFGGRAVA